MAEYKKKQQPLGTQIYNELGKVPPNAVDIEEIVLGQLMIEPDAAVLIMDLLKPECFYKDANQKVFAAIRELATREDPINMMTVIEELRKKEELERIGGAFYITNLTQKVSSAAHVEYHAKIIAQKFIQRELIRVSSEIQNRAFDPDIDVSDLIDFSEGALLGVAENRLKKESSPIADLIGEAIKNIHDAGKREDGLSGLATGFTKIDRVTSGLQASDLIIIAARPSMGKTAFILSMLRNMAVDHNIPVAMFSLEMSNIQLVMRLIVSETELDHSKIKNGKLTTEEWAILEERTKSLLSAPIFLDDTPALSIFEFRAKCRRLHQKHKIKCVFVDYLQLMNAPNAGSREQEISTISRQLKAIAKELEIPVIALSQLNRSIDKTNEYRPQLSNLRESGAIEQDADIVAFIHRPEYYKILEDNEGNSTVGMAEIIIAKHRNGALEDIQLRFEKQFAKFTENFDGILPTSLSDITFGDKPKMNFSSKMNAETTTFSNNPVLTEPFPTNKFDPFDAPF